MKRHTVQDVMTKDVITVAEESPFIEIADTLAEHDITAVPVMNAEGRLTGIVSEADLLHKQEYKRSGPDQWPLLERLRHRNAVTKAGAVDARGLMSNHVVTVAPSATVAEAARLFAARGLKHAPVVDESGRLVGIVSRRDLLRVFRRSDDDIRNEIITDVLLCGLWQDPSTVDVSVIEGVVHLSGRVERKSLIPIVVRMTAATDAVADVIADLAYDHDDTRPNEYPRA